VVLELTGMEPSVLTGIELLLLIVELSETGIESMGLGIDEDSQESQPETVWLEDTMTSGLE
jgi:diacylglycerol kinase